MPDAAFGRTVESGRRRSAPRPAVVEVELAMIEFHQASAARVRARRTGIAGGGGGAAAASTTRRAHPAGCGHASADGIRDGRRLSSGRSRSCSAPWPLRVAQTCAMSVRSPCRMLATSAAAKAARQNPKIKKGQGLDFPIKTWRAAFAGEPHTGQQSPLPPRGLLRRRSARLFKRGG